MVDCQLYDLHAGGHHLTNVLLHAATAMLLFLVLRRMTGRLWPSALVAALFAVHPLRAESVAWVTERKDVLSGLFFMLTLWAYLGYVRAPVLAGPIRIADRSVCPGTDGQADAGDAPLRALIVGLLAAEVGLGRAQMSLERSCAAWLSSNRHLFIEKIPLLLLAAGDCLVTILIQDHALVSGEHLPLWWRLGNAAVTYVTYLGQFFCPVGLVAIYPRPGLDLPWWEIGAACSVLASVTAAAFLGRRRCPYLLVGWLWYLGMLVPVIGLLQVGCTSMADRFTYLPQIGLAVGLVWGVADLCRAWPYRRWACGVASAALLAVLIGCAFRQTSFWCDSETLWTRALALTSRNDMAHNGLGGALANEGRLEEAIAHFRLAIAISPYVVMFRTNLANALIAAGRSDEARNSIARSCGSIPTAPRRMTVWACCWPAAAGLDEAMAYFRRSLEINPDNADTCYDLGKILWQRGRQDEARKLFLRAAETVPDYAVVHNNLGVAMADRGRWSEAIRHFERALDGDPKCRSARANLGKALAACGRYEEAIAQYRTALRLDPHDAEALRSARPAAGQRKRKV